MGLKLVPRMTRTCEQYVVLPDDVERLIFEFVAQEDRNTALQLVTLATHIRLWIEPEIYRRITLFESHAPKFAWTIRNSRKPASWFRDHVKALCLVNTDLPDLNLILSVCTGVYSLAVWNESIHITLPDNTDLTQMSLPFVPSWPIFNTISSMLTHLELVLYQKVELPAFSALRHFPRLQYFALLEASQTGQHPCTELLTALIPHISRSVRVIVVFCEALWVENKAFVDDRIIISAPWAHFGRRGPLAPWLVERAFSDPTWGYETAEHRAQPTFWEKAEVCVGDRRKYYAQYSNETRCLVYPEPTLKIRQDSLSVP